MTDFTRVTVVGSERRAEIVVVSDEPYAGLLPRFLEILGEHADTEHPLSLVRVTGDELDLAADSLTQTVLDGEVLHLVRRSDAPPPPEVSDVTDATSDNLAMRGGLWGATARQGVGAAAITAAFLAAGNALTQQPLFPSALLAAVLASALVLTIVAVVLGRMGKRWLAIVTTAASIGLAIPMGIATSSVIFAALSIPLVGTIAALWAWIALGVGAGLGLRIRPVLTASVVGGLLALTPATLWVLEMSSLGVWGILAVLAVLSCGVLPAWAMAASGLTGLDDAVALGESAPRRHIVRSLDETYRTLDWLVGAVALTIATSATVLLVSDNPWSVGLGVVTVVVTALRTRTFPGALQGVLLWAAVIVASVIGIATHLDSALGIVALVVVAGLAALLAGVRPAAHQRARLRGFGNTVEAIAVIMMLPLLLGSFDLYASLLETF